MSSNFVGAFRRIAVVVLGCVAAAGLLAAPASAQTNSRLCGQYFHKAPGNTGPGPSSWLLLAEIAKGTDTNQWSKGSHWCFSSQTEQIPGYTRATKVYYSVCETVSADIGWQFLPQRPGGYNSTDICQTMARHHFYRVGFEENPRRATVFLG